MAPIACCFAVVCIGLLVPLTTLAAPLDPQDFPPPAVRLTADAAASARPRVAIDGEGNAVVIWQDARYGNAEVLWQKFSLTGAEVSPLVRVTENASSSVRPDISWSSPDVSHIVWQEGESNNVGSVYLVRRDGDGARKEWEVSVGSLGGNARVAGLSGGDADVVWFRRTAADQDVYYRRYHLDGTYGCQQRFSAGTLPDLEKSPVVAVRADASASLLWYDLGQWWDYQLREGTVSAVCSPAQQILVSDNALRPAIDAAGARVERVFELGGRIRRLNPAGGYCQLSGMPGGSSRPAVGTTADTSYCIWQDTRNGNADIYFCQYVDCSNLSGDLPLTLSPQASENPDLAVNHTNGEWVAVWQTNLNGNTEIYLTSSRLLGPQPPFLIASAVFDKQLYHNGSETATVTVVTQSLTAGGSDLSLHAVLKTNLGDQFDLGVDSFSLAAGADHASTFQWPVPGRDHPWDFSLTLDLASGGQTITSIEVSKAAAGTSMSQAEMDQLIAELTDNECAPPVTGCSTYFIGLVPGFGFPTAVSKFKTAVCEAGRQWALGNEWKAGLAGLRSVLPAIGVAFGHLPGPTLKRTLIVKGGQGVISCGRELLNALTGQAFPMGLAVQDATIDSLAAEIGRQAVVTGQPFSNEILLQGQAAFRIGVDGAWTTEDTVAVAETFVFPGFGPGCRWAHVGPTPIPLGTGGENPLSRIDVEIVSEGAGSIEFGVLHRVSPDSTAWIRYAIPIPMNPGSVARLALADTSTSYRLFLDTDGNGTADFLYYPDGTVVGVAEIQGGPGAGLQLVAFNRSPVTPGAVLSYNLPQEGAISLKLFDVAGRMCGVLDEGYRSPGWHTVVWKGLKEASRPLVAGIYFVRLSTPWGMRSTRAVIVK